MRPQLGRVETVATRTARQLIAGERDAAALARASAEHAAASAALAHEVGSRRRAEEAEAALRRVQVKN